MKRWEKALIGKRAEVIFHQQTFFGTIVDETRYTIVLELKSGQLKRIIKSHALIKLIDQGIILEGKNLRGRVEERIKERRSKRW